MKCEVELRSELFQNIVMSGGSSMFLGIANRLFREIVKYVGIFFANKTLKPVF